MAKNQNKIEFLGSLPHGRKCLQLDAEGEAILTLAIPASHAKIITDNFERLQDTAFKVTIEI
jgi:hypothetical protein